MSYKKKCYSLLIGASLFFVLAYKLSFSETFKQRNEINEKKVKINWLKAKEKEMPFIKMKLAQIEKTCNNNDTNSVRDKLTAFISDFAENQNCVVTEIPSPRFYKSHGNKIETNSFTIKGGFKELLGLVQALEEKFKLLAKVVSVRYYAIKENQNKRKALYLMITTQSFTKIKTQ